MFIDIDTKVQIISINDGYYKWVKRNNISKWAPFFPTGEEVISMFENLDWNDIGDKTIIDPSCGSGAFLEACILLGAKPQNIYGNVFDNDLLYFVRNRLNQYRVPWYNTHQGNPRCKDCISLKSFTPYYIFTEEMRDREDGLSDLYAHPVHYEQLDLWQLIKDENM